MTKLIAAILAAASIAILASTSAEARRHSSAPLQSEFCQDRYCWGNPVEPRLRAPSYRTRPAVQPRRLVKSRSAVPTPRARPATLPAVRLPAKAAASYATRIVDHPPGCPRRAFCGCGAALEVFGKNVRAAWLARWWYRFPVAEPGPGRVAVRWHHVFVIRQVVDRARGIVLAYDANSGGRKTRIHLRSLAGYSVRDPRGGVRYASAL